mmetsp:Transcript_15179/g.47375  ORF Transcript_15179/g.47375 Transcript_15179/m.47375 type:complete len:227 (+) Transcript_15179:1800-2480(+)
MISTAATPSSSALCASMGPRTTSPMAYTPLAVVSYDSLIVTCLRSFSSTPALSRPRLSVKGRRPTETSTTSASNDLGEPPAAASVCRVMGALTSSGMSADVHLRFRWNSMPCFLSTFCVSLATSASHDAPATWSINSTTVTLDPRRDHTLAISRPMTPPPTTTMRSGTFLRDRAPVEVTMRVSSTGRKGRSTGTEPVAMMMPLDAVCFSPSTSISFAETKVPCPRR